MRISNAPQFALPLADENKMSARIEQRSVDDKKVESPGGGATSRLGRLHQFPRSEHVRLALQLGHVRPLSDNRPHVQHDTAGDDAHRRAQHGQRGSTQALAAGGETDEKDEICDAGG